MGLNWIGVKSHWVTKLVICSRFSLSCVVKRVSSKLLVKRRSCNKKISNYPTWYWCMSQFLPATGWTRFDTSCLKEWLVCHIGTLCMMFWSQISHFQCCTVWSQSIFWWAYKLTWSPWEKCTLLPPRLPKATHSVSLFQSLFTLIAWCLCRYDLAWLGTPNLRTHSRCMFIVQGSYFNIQIPRRRHSSILQHNFHSIQL